MPDETVLVKRKGEREFKPVSESLTYTPYVPTYTPVASSPQGTIYIDDVGRTYIDVATAREGGVILTETQKPVVPPPKTFEEKVLAKAGIPRQEDVLELKYRQLEPIRKPLERVARFGAGAATGFVTAPRATYEFGKGLLTRPVETVRETAREIKHGFTTDPAYAAGSLAGSSLFFKGAGKGLKYGIGKTTTIKPIKTLGITETKIVSRTPERMFGEGEGKTVGVGGKLRTGTKIEYKTGVQVAPKVIEIKGRAIPTEAQSLSAGKFKTLVETKTFLGTKTKTIKGKFKEAGFAGKEIGEVTPSLRYGAIKIGRKTTPFESQMLAKKIFEKEGTTIFRTSTVTKAKQPLVSLSKDIVRDVTKEPDVGDVFVKRDLKLDTGGKSLLFPKGATKAITKEQRKAAKEFRKETITKMERPVKFLKAGPVTSTRLKQETGLSPKQKTAIIPKRKQEEALFPKQDIFSLPISKSGQALFPLSKQASIQLSRQDQLFKQLQAQKTATTTQAGISIAFPATITGTKLFPKSEESGEGIFGKRKTKRLFERKTKYEPSLIGIFSKRKFKTPKVSLGIEVRPVKRRGR